NGFKTGGCDADSTGNKKLKHNMVLKKCLSFYNKAKGFDQNHNRGSVTMYNCTAFNNGNGSGTAGDQYNFAFPETLATSLGKVLTVENCISFGSNYGVQLCPGPTPVVVATNSWSDSSTYPTGVTSATTTDFISIDTAGVRGQRNADGSLREINFMHLAAGSHFIDAGTDIGLPYNGLKPDLGCFESDYPATSIKENNESNPHMFQLYQNYPNPFNPSTEIKFYLSSPSFVSVNVYNLLGQNVAALVHEMRQAGNYVVQWNASQMASGVYFVRLSAITGNGTVSTLTRKMMFVK
ncbi:MAG TPA: T9SS type A sorting domain-containing protein, partial [Bacteroidota bacterium]|nr:T9SS type A sorting domain-containing protein [Bacteroidota bacterium]